MLPCDNPPLIELTNQKKPCGHNPWTCMWTNQSLLRHHLPKWNPNPNFHHLLPSPWKPPPLSAVNFLTTASQYNTSKHPPSSTFCTTTSSTTIFAHLHGSLYALVHATIADFNLHGSGSTFISASTTAPPWNLHQFTPINTAQCSTTKTQQNLAHQIRKPWQHHFLHTVPHQARELATHSTMEPAPATITRAWEKADNHCSCVSPWTNHHSSVIFLHAPTAVLQPSPLATQIWTQTITIMLVGEEPVATFSHHAGEIWPLLDLPQLPREKETMEVETIIPKRENALPRVNLW